jgi:hypothetical protein
VDVLISHILDVTVETQAEESGREDVESSGRTVLDDDNRAQVLGDYLGKAGEVLNDCA